jgi:hypothetical protein
MGSTENIMEVGDFISYGKYTMAVVGKVNESTFVALCKENQKVAKIKAGDEHVKIVMKRGCRSLVKGIYDDMNLL